MKLCSSDLESSDPTYIEVKSKGIVALLEPSIPEKSHFNKGTKPKDLGFTKCLIFRIGVQALNSF